MRVTIFFYQHEDIVDIDLHLPHKFHFKNNVGIDVFLLNLSLPVFLVQIEIDALVILKLALGQDLVAPKVVKGGEDISEAEDMPEQGDKLLFHLFADDGRIQGKASQQPCYQFAVTLGVLHASIRLFLIKAVVIVIIGLQQNNAARVLVAKQGNGLVRLLLQVPEADDIAEGFDRIEDAVGAGIGLNQAVVPQVLVHPQGIERGGVEAREEHVDHHQQVDLPLLHPQRQVLVVILELVGRSAVIGVEGLVIVINGLVQKIARSRVRALSVEARVFRVGLIGIVAENSGDVQVLAPLGQLLPEFLVIRHGHGNGTHRQNGVEPGQPLPFKRIKAVALGLLVKMLDDVLDHSGHALRRGQRLFAVNSLHLVVFHAVGHFHRVDIVDAERQHVAVIDGVDDGVGVELVAEGLFRGFQQRVAPLPRIDGKNGRAREAEQVIVFECLDNGRMQIAELGSVTFVKHQHDAPLEDGVPRIAADEDAQLLDGGDNDPAVRVVQLPGQHLDGIVAVGRAPFKAVIFLDGLVIQVASVHHEQHLVHVGEFRGKLGRLERGQGLAGAGGMPDVAAAFERPGLFVVVGDLDALEDALRGRDLVRPHDQQQFLGGEHAEAGEYIEQRVLGEKGSGEVNEVGNDGIVAVRPAGREFKGIAGFFAPAPAPGGLLLQVRLAGGVGIILGVRAVGDDEDLHIFVQARSGPEAVPLVAPDLVEGLADGHAPALEFHMYQGKAIDQDGHVIAGRVAALPLLILVDDLKPVIVDIFLVQQRDVLGAAIVSREVDDALHLEAARFFHNAFIGIGEMLAEKRLPLAVGEMVVVDQLQLAAQVGDKVGFPVDGQVFVALGLQLTDKFLFQIGFVLIGIRAHSGWRVLRNNRAFRTLRHHVETGHTASLNVRSLLR